MAQHRLLSTDYSLLLHAQQNAEVEPFQWPDIFGNVQNKESHSRLQSASTNARQTAALPVQEYAVLSHGERPPRCNVTRKELATCISFTAGETSQTWFRHQNRTWTLISYKNTPRVNHLHINGVMLYLEFACLAFTCRVYRNIFSSHIDRYWRFVPLVLLVVSYQRLGSTSPSTPPCSTDIWCHTIRHYPPFLSSNSSRNSHSWCLTVVVNSNVSCSHSS